MMGKNLGSDDNFVYIASEHGAGGKERAVCWWHHSCGDCPQTDPADERGGQVINHKRQYVLAVSFLKGRLDTHVKLAPIWTEKFNVTS